MNENLFTFSGESAGSSGGDPFDLGDFTELPGPDPDNPFADLPAEGGGTAGTAQLEAPQTSQAKEQKLEEHPQSEQDIQTAEQNGIGSAPALQTSVTPQPKTPPAPTLEAGEDHGDEAAEEENPLLAAINRQEERNARKAAEPIFAQLPVFSYNGTEEPIENIEQTFEELRLAKADDFPVNVNEKVSPALMNF